MGKMAHIQILLCESFFFFNRDEKTPGNSLFWTFHFPHVPDSRTLVLFWFLNPIFLCQFYGIIIIRSESGIKGTTMKLISASVNACLFSWYACL